MRRRSIVVKRTVVSMRSGPTPTVYTVHRAHVRFKDPADSSSWMWDHNDPRTVQVGVFKVYERNASPTYQQMADQHATDEWPALDYHATDAMLRNRYPEDYRQPYQPVSDAPLAPRPTEP